MSYDKALYEAQKHWRAKQNRQRRIEQEQAESLKYYEDNKEEIEIVKKAAMIAISLEKVAPIEISVGMILLGIGSIKELDFYYQWCCGRLI